MSADNELTYAMDRAAIWKAALNLLKDSGCDFAPGDVTELAEFLAGDNIPFPIQELTSSGDDESADSSTEGTE